VVSGDTWLVDRSLKYYVKSPRDLHPKDRESRHDNTPWGCIRPHALQAGSREGVLRPVYYFLCRVGEDEAALRFALSYFF